MKYLAIDNRRLNIEMFSFRSLDSRNYVCSHAGVSALVRTLCTETYCLAVCSIFSSIYRISNKEQQHITEINQLQQKLALVREENEEDRFRELEESRQQLSENFQKDLEAIVRELKLQHQKEIDHLISEAESNQSNEERDVFETWKAAIVEKHEEEMRELRNEQQKEWERTRELLEKEKSEEVERVSSNLNVKHAKELAELRVRLTSEWEEELKKARLEHQSNFDKEIGKFSVEYQSLREQHEVTVRELQDRLNSTLAAHIEPLNRELLACKDLIQEKDVENENLKRKHERYLKELKQRNFDDLVEEISEVRADLAVDAAREVEIVKLEADYKIAQKVKELKDAHSQEIAEATEKAESLEKEKKTLEELLRSHAEETRELQAKLEIEKNELKRLHDQEIQDLRTRLDVEQKNVLNELKGKLMKEMDDMQEMWRHTLEDQHKELEGKFAENEERLKEKELEKRKNILDDLNAGMAQHFSQISCGHFSDDN